MRIALSLTYDGQKYHGWQRQSGVTSVQALLEEALSKVADEPIEVYCAGRTDAKVHATEQIIHFDTQSERAMRSWVLGANSHLPKDVAVQWAVAVKEDFHARFSAKARRYWYVIYNRSARTGVLHNHVTWWMNHLDERRMQEGAQYLLGEHDFSSFQSAECQANHARRNIYYLTIKRLNEVVIVDICANAFLHHMVRNIVGVLAVIGENKQPPQWVEDVLKARDRKLAGVTAPAQGLYLVGVEYPKEFKLPQKKSIGPWFCQFVL